MTMTSALKGVNSRVDNMDKVVSWNPLRLKEADEAKKIYQKARLGLSSIVDELGNPVESFAKVSGLGYFVIKAPVIGPDELAFRILDETGDQRLIWKMSNPHQVEEAKKRFEEHIKKGGKAFAVFRDGGKAHRIKSFLDSREEVILEDSTDKRAVDVSLSLKKFIDRIFEVKLLPKTFPG